MTQYRVTFEDETGHACTGGGFEAKSDQEASALGRTFVPAQTSGYEIWREDESSRRPLVFAEWILSPPK